MTKGVEFRSRLTHQCNQRKRSVRIMAISNVDVLRCYRELRIFGMPSTREGFGLVFCEALRFGMPCICRYDSAAEIILDNETGYVVPEESEPIAQACLRLIIEDNMAQSISDKGRARFESVFTFDVFKK